jgi:hypothetical protein
VSVAFQAALIGLLQRGGEASTVIVVAIISQNVVGMYYFQGGT